MIKTTDYYPTKTTALLSHHLVGGQFQPESGGQFHLAEGGEFAWIFHIASTAFKSSTCATPPIRSSTCISIVRQMDERNLHKSIAKKHYSDKFINYQSPHKSSSYFSIKRLSCFPPRQSHNILAVPDSIFFLHQFVQDQV